MTTLSLFDDDPTSRVLRRLHIAPGGRISLVRFQLAVLACGWVVPLVLAALSGRVLTGSANTDFFHDLNLPVQTLVGLLLVIAQPMIDEHVRLAGAIFASSTLLKDESAYGRAADELAWWRRANGPEIGALVLGIVFTIMWAIPDWQANHESDGMVLRGNHTTFNLMGWWVVFVWSPLFQFLWVRWFVKVVLWTRFLVRMSRQELRLAAGHPDQAGGLAFLGEIQGMFGVLIFAVGIVAAAASMQAVLYSNQLQWNLILSVAGFVVGGPIVFLAPLLLFSRRMYVARMEGVGEYEILLTQFINAFEKKHVRGPLRPEDHLAAINEFAALSNITNLHAHVSKMHVVPFDLGTVTRLVLSAVTPMLPLAARFLPWPWLKELLQTIFGH